MIFHVMFVDLILFFFSYDRSLGVVGHIMGRAKPPEHWTVYSACWTKGVAAEVQRGILSTSCGRTSSSCSVRCTCPWHCSNFEIAVENKRNEMQQILW